VTSAEHAARPGAWAEPGPVVRFVFDTYTVLRAELIKIRHDPFEMASRAAQPLLWLVVFGQIMAQTHAIPTGDLSYIDYLAPGVLAQSAMFSAIFFGLAVIWERDLGLVHKLLVSPASRSSLILGKAIASGGRALVQGVIVYVASYAIGVDLRLDVLSILGVACVVVLGSALFATFSMIIACLVRTRERFMGIGQLITMPLFFASSAIYPISMMPPWLQVISLLNPLTYMVDALRTLMIVGATSAHGVPLDIAVLSVVTGALVIVGARLYPRLAQ
jgi:ABC-2 type transport system permease protein